MIVRAGRRTGRGRAFLLWIAALGIVGASIGGCQTAQWPVEGPVSSPFGLRITGIVPNLHRGVDIAVPVGTPVRPVLDGRVRFAGMMSAYGQVVWIDHSDDLLSVYAHLSEITVVTGQDVTKGVVIGRTGDSGSARGPHLHLELWRWGREVDPIVLLGVPPGG